MFDGRCSAVVIDTENNPRHCKHGHDFTVHCLGHRPELAVCVRDDAVFDEMKRVCVIGHCKMKTVNVPAQPIDLTDCGIPHLIEPAPDAGLDAAKGK
jgi:hypothetical protein